MTPTLTLTMHRADSNPNYVPKFGQPAMEQGSGDSCLPAPNQELFWVDTWLGESDRQHREDLGSLGDFAHVRTSLSACE